MKKIFLIYFLLLPFLVLAQKSSSVEKSIFTVQTGAVGIWVNNETRLTDEIALRTEIGLYTEIVANSGFFMAPEITLEPRWYYNIKKRVVNNKDITNNSASFVTLKINFKSDVFEISGYDDDFDRAKNSFAIIPKWGIKRNIGRHFNYELGCGAGYVFQKNFSITNSGGIVVDLHLRIGYNF
tara:strand:+ start:77 stop:622 length:546 start_codon:yes stop_codon:yes gene_type:complete